MKVDLFQEEIDSAVSVGEQTLAKYKDNLGEKYANTLNSHVKGRLGEFAFEKWLLEHGIVAESHFRGDVSDRLCDIEIPTASKFKRVEIKTWSSEFWQAWGRCIAVKQARKVLTQTDAILWCRVDLPSVKSVAQLKNLGSIEVLFIAYSLPEDAVGAPKRWTGPYGKQVYNHQLEDDQLRRLEEFLADVAGH